MIESCPKKRMLLGISFLGVLTVLVLIIESHWTERTTHPLKRQQFPVEQNSTCFLKEKFEVVKECEPCSDFEIASQSIGVCIHTHFKELLKCESGEMVTRSCDKAAYLEERTFWRFEGSAFVLSVVFTFLAVSRKKVLNKRMLQRVQRQIANSV